MFADALPTLAAAILAVVGDALRAGALVAALLAPGYVWGRVLFGRRPIPTADRWVFALGLSLASFVVGAFVLNWTPWGLQRATWATWFVVVVVGGILVLIARGDVPGAPSATARVAARARRPASIQVVAAIVLVAMAYAVSYLGAVRQPREGFTQAWIVPIEGRSVATAGFGLTNHEDVPRRFDVELWWNGTLQQRFEGVLLRPGEAWTEELAVAGYATPGELALVAFRDGEAAAHRRVALGLGGAGHGGGPPDERAAPADAPPLWLDRSSSPVHARPPEAEATR
jgi:uncharacterized membrane protein